MQRSHAWLEMISPHPRPGGDKHVSSYTSHGRSAPGWVEPLRVIYDHELVLMTEGEFVFEIGRKKYPCPAGTYIIIPPGKYETAYRLGKGYGHRYWSHFDWIFSQEERNAPIYTYHPGKPHWEKVRYAPKFIPREIFHGKITHPEKIIPLMEKFCWIMKNGTARQKLLSRPMLLEILLELLLPESTDAPRRSRSIRLASQTRQLLEDVVLQKRHGLSIQSLLGESGHTYAHLCRIFKKEYGIPPLQYLHQLRINQAKRLFQETNLNVAQAAYELGFDDPSYFSQLFKKTTGVSPSLFQRETP